MQYNWELPDWPDFKFDLSEVAQGISDFLLEAGEVHGMLKSLPEEVNLAFLVESMLSEAIKTSEIEGEFLSREDVMSSIRNNLGLAVPAEPVRDQRSEGMGQLMVGVRKTCDAPLTEAQLFDWHVMVLGNSLRIRAGRWRVGSEPMQVISGSIGKEKIHFQAPPSNQVPHEMERFVRWFNDTAPGGSGAKMSAPVRAAIAHLYFESIHPFEDGNGRIGRVIAEKALLQTLGKPLVISLSRTIEANKQRYYTALESAQRSNEISEWIQYFVDVVLQAQIQSKQLIHFILQKTRFFDRYAGQLNERQLKVIQRVMEAGKDGFEGGLSAKKYMSIAGTSKATATRDLQNLLEMGILNVTGGGRSVRYHLVL